MFTISNEDLKDAPECKEGDVVDCPNCGGQHPIVFGKDQEGMKTNVMGVVVCKTGSYLVCVDGKLLPRKKPEQEFEDNAG